ncbi:MAG TPA: bifunctional DNA-binding transcriptional regulator/O6-methylguanine-DNA methyltransferase Ada [Bryobacteraceae bacterium]|nr:bifunctional DNA-binding transcriptional regulator/O6-methylguanine-DNA methyltransferase Ada [Bryobacteraceae bacterium]
MATMLNSSLAINSQDEQAFWEAHFWQALETRDAQMDGVFFFAVLTTGVYCRPSCPSRRPRRENVIFFQRRDAAERAGFRACLRCKPDRERARDPQSELVEKICRYLEQHLDEATTLEGLSRHLGLSPFHLQRTFKAATGITPRAYADFCRLESFKGGLREGRAVTTALYDAGYGSSSRLYERAASQLGMTPTAYRRGGAGVQIRYDLLDTPAGTLLVAATGKGVCAIRFGDSEKKLEESVRGEFPAADLRRDAAFLEPWADRLRAHLDGRLHKLDIPLDIQATAFQRRVWEYLQTIPYGSTKSYGEIAKAIRNARAARAVARACASNPVAVVIPCHRVVCGDGDIGGYRWGAGRKRKLLEMERGS